MQFLAEKIRVTCETLYGFAHRKIGEAEQLEVIREAEYKKDNRVPTEGWEPARPGSRVRGVDGHAWFRTHLHTPPAKEGTRYYARCITGRETQWDHIIPQSLIYLNGKLTQACDGNHTEIDLEPDTDYELCNYLYLGMEEGWVPLEVSLWRLDVPSEQLYYDLQTALDCYQLLNPNQEEAVRLLDTLEQGANRIDFRALGSDAYYESLEQAREYLQSELYGKLCSTEGKPVVDCIGHTHVDVEWLWHRAQTREKIQRSFANALHLMKQYPEYKFMLSQPELYRYLKEEAPELYAELKKLVREGRWEPEGAMYVEADCNLISGESFVRQIMQGKKFFKDEFGVECKILFLPDVFGYSSALPQILTKSGIRHFVTSKISWNDTNTMPVDCFLWQGLDGTEIFTNFITTQDFAGFQPQRGTTYVGLLTPSDIKGTWNKFLQKDYTSHVMTTYGYGDGGGGPSKRMLETQRRLSKGLPGMPVTRMSGLLEHLDLVREEFDRSCIRTKRTPRWVGELYLEYHRGTYTSQAKNKRLNRKSELLLQKAEALSYLDLLRGGSYDAEGLYHAWNLVLHDQFHDIIPGSSIPEVYEGTDRDYARVGAFCRGVIDEKLQNLADRVESSGGLLVYNPLGFARTAPICVSGRTLEPRQAIPAYGWQVLPEEAPQCLVQIQGLEAHSPHYDLTLDRAGRLTRLYDREAGREILLPGTCGNELQAFEDYPMQYDNWEISEYYKEKMWVLDEPAEITPIFDGSRGGFRIVKPYFSSVITQELWLYSRSRRIDFETRIDWHEHHQILKAAFPLDVHATEAAYEVQYGYVKRPTHANTSWDQAKFEVYGHRWVDLSETGYGVSLLNDCKYGFNTEGSTLKLTMLKCGTYPDPQADQGEHLFTYSLLPHAGDFREAGVIQEAHSLNQPLTALPIKAHTGTLPASFSLVSCDQDHVIVDTVKKAEADDGMIVRLYEAHDRRGKVSLTVPAGFTDVWLCDLMENQLEALPLERGTVTIPVHNFEIITLKFL